MGRGNSLNFWSLLWKIIKKRCLFCVSVLLPKVHQRYDLDGDASMAKVSNYDFNLYISHIMRILKWKLLDFQMNNVNVKKSCNMLVRILIDRSVFINKSSKSIVKPYFVYKTCLYIKKQNKTKKQASKVQVLWYCIIQCL